jgi:hypothetical protein
MKNILKIIMLLFVIILTSKLYAQDEIKFKQPILISSAGQSADVKLAGLLLKKQELDSKTVTLAKPADLEGVNTLIIVPGFSSKGLGAAGISADEENERLVKLIDAAKEKNIPIVLLHIGGKARRKGQSDEFIKTAANAAKYMIVVEQGNEDNLFTELSASLKIPLVLVEKIPSAGEPLGKIFK